MAAVRSLARNAVDLLFPPRCLLCGGWPDDQATCLCVRCRAALDRARAEPACPRCASAVAPHEVREGRCARCRRRRPPVAGTVRVGAYADGLGHLIRSYKYHAREELEPLLAGWLADAVARAPWLDRVEAVVSVPTHWKHRLRSPLYAADAIASVVAGRRRFPRLPILKRLRAGPHQIGLSYTARAENVRGAFAIRRAVKLRDARLLLIDDVKTTGATINECARVLRRGGAAEVYAAVLVTVRWDHPTGYALSSI